MDVSDNVTNLCDIEINLNIHCIVVTFLQRQSKPFVCGGAGGGGRGVTLIHINFQQFYLRIDINVYDIDINITIYSCYYFRPVMITS